MLYLAIGFCAALLAAANLAARHAPMPRLTIGLLCGGFLVAHPFVARMILPTVNYFVLFLLIGLPIWSFSDNRSPNAFWPISVVAMILAFGITGTMAWQTQVEYARLREKYPMESLEGRLPLLEKGDEGRSRSSDALGRLTLNEEKYDQDEARYDGGFRNRRLSRLHEDSVQSFIDSFGFGYHRISPYPTEGNLADDLEAVPSRPQPGYRESVAGSPGEWTILDPHEEKSLVGMLTENVLDFADPQVFGYFRDRKHVAGFVPHRVHKVPDPQNDLKLQTIDLVGLLLHDGPVVYVTANLPRMDEVRDAPARSLDRFEWTGLGSLKGGEDVLIVRDVQTTRMLGAIRSTKQCLSCHGGERGDLLGAFSYTLRMDKPGASPDKSASR